MRSKRINACIEAAREHPLRRPRPPAACCLFAGVYDASRGFFEPPAERQKRGFRTGFEPDAVAATLLQRKVIPETRFRRAMRSRARARQSGHRLSVTPRRTRRRTGRTAGTRADACRVLEADRALRAGGRRR